GSRPANVAAAVVPSGSVTSTPSSHSSTWWAVTTRPSAHTTPLEGPRRRPNTATTYEAACSTAAANCCERSNAVSPMGPAYAHGSARRAAPHQPGGQAPPCPIGQAVRRTLLEQEQSVAGGQGHGLGARLGPQLAQDRVDVELGRVFADAEA